MFVLFEGSKNLRSGQVMVT